MGAVTTDASGTADGFLINGPAWVPTARIAGGLAFDGVDDYVAGGTLPPIGLADDFTWSCFVFLRPMLSAHAVIVGNRGGGAGGGAEFVKLTPNNFQFFAGGTPYMNYSVPLNEWRHLCVVKSGANLTYYSNGSPVATVVASSGMGSNPLYLGGDFNFGQEMTRGTLDEVRLYTRALGASEVSSLAAGVATGFSPSIEVAILDSSGAVNAAATDAVTLAVVPDASGAALRGTTTVNAVNGVAVFRDLWVDKAAAGLRLTASSSSAPSVSSDAFDVRAGTTAVLAFETQPSNAVAGASIAPAIEVSALDPLGIPVADGTSITIAMGSNPGGATLAGTTTAFTVAGVATFSNLRIDRGGTGYTLVARSGPATPLTSTPFDVSERRLAFVVQPTNALTGGAIAPAVQVAIQDGTGATITTANDPVTIQLGTNPSGATLSGTLTVNAVNGIATFQDLSLDRADAGYTLAARSGGISAVAPGIVSWWRAEGDGSDAVSTNHGMLANGVAFTSPAKVGQGFALNGVDQFVAVGSPPSLDLTGSFTLEAWVNVSTLSEGQLAAVVTKWGQSTSLDCYGLWLVKSGGVIRALTAVGVAGVGDGGMTGGTVPQGRWTHVAATYDSASGTNVLFVNGQQVATRTKPGGTFASPKDLLIGREDSTAPRPFHGSIDEVAIFARALTPAEVQNVFAAGGAGKQATASAAFDIGPLFTPTGSLATARSNHTATLLPNGKVLVVGGANSTGNPSTDAELFDPVTGTFSATGSLATARGVHTATLLPSGKVLIAGGPTTSAAELYDPATETFSPTGTLNQARIEHTATLLQDGRVLLAGGRDGMTYLSSAELYDPATGNFTVTGSLGVIGAYRTATLLQNGKVLVAAGWNGTSFLAGAELYDPATSTFTATGSLATARYVHSATLLPDGKVLVAGGYGDPSAWYLSSAELYDPAAGTFSTTGSLTGIRGEHSATLLPNGKVLVAGGYGGPGAIHLVTAELYDPAAGTFTSTSSMGTARKLHTATLLTSGAVLVAGGINGPGYVASAELYR